MPYRPLEPKEPVRLIGAKCEQERHYRTNYPGNNEGAEPPDQKSPRPVNGLVVDASKNHGSGVGDCQCDGKAQARR